MTDVDRLHAPAVGTQVALLHLTESITDNLFDLPPIDAGPMSDSKPLVNAEISLLRLAMTLMCGGATRQR